MSTKDISEVLVFVLEQWIGSVRPGAKVSQRSAHRFNGGNPYYEHEITKDGKRVGHVAISESSGLVMWARAANRTLVSHSFYKFLHEEATLPPKEEKP